MSNQVSYRKFPNTRAKSAGGTTVLFRTDKAAAFSLNETGEVIWEALEYFPTVDGLTSILIEARPGANPDSQRTEIRHFLDGLASLGLVQILGPVKIRKADDITSELVGADLIIFKGGEQKVRAINDTGAILWSALDHYSSQDDLVALLAEAWPQKPADELRTLVSNFILELVDLGFVQYETEIDQRQ